MPSDLFEQLQAAAPSKARVARIQRELSRSMRPALPLPSDRVLIGLLFGGLLAIILLGAWLAGFAGMSGLTTSQRISYYGPLLVSEWLLAAALTEQMVPGSRRRFTGLPALLVLFGATALLVVVLFPESEMRNFVAQGLPCLRLGLLCALPVAAAGTIVLRRGFITDRIAAAVTAGSLAGFAGVGVLALHCPIYNSAHILAWHLGVAVIATAAGAIAGWLLADLFWH